MNFRTTLLLIVVLAAVGLVAFFTRDTQTRSLEVTNDEPQRLLDVRAADVNRISISAAGEKPIVLSRDGVQWSIEQPVKSPAELSEVSRLVTDLTSLQTRGKLTAEQASSEGTGLSSPSATIELGAMDGNTVQLDFGQRTAAGDNLYVRRKGESGGWIIDGQIAAQLDRPVSAWRRKRLFDVSMSQVRKITIESPSRSFEVSRAALDAPWAIGGPTTMPADKREVADLLNAIASASAEEFVSETVEASQRRRIDPPQLTVTLNTAAPTTQPTAALDPAERKLIVGGYTDVTRKSVYAKSSDSPALVTLRAASLDALRKSPLDLRDREVLKIDAQNVKSIRIEKPSPPSTQPTTQPSLDEIIELAHMPTTMPTTMPATTQAAAVPPKWQVTKTGGQIASANVGAMQSLFAAISPIRAIRYLEPGPTTQPSARLTLTLDTGVGAVEISFQSTDDGRTWIGEYNGLRFEAEPGLIEALQADFTRSHNAAPAQNNPNIDDATLPPARRAVDPDR